MRFNDRESCGDLLRSVVSAALFLVGTVCAGLGSLFLFVAFASGDGQPDLEPSDEPSITTAPSQTTEATVVAETPAPSQTTEEAAVVAEVIKTEEGTVIAEAIKGEGFKTDVDESRLWGFGAAAFLLGVGALLILASMLIECIGRVRKLETSVDQIAKSRS